MGKRPTPPTIDAVLTSLLEKVRGDPEKVEGYTTGELKQLWGVSANKTRNAVLELRRKGLLGVRKVTRISEMDNSGRSFTVYFPADRE